MTVRTPIELTKDTPNNRYQRVGNKVAYDDGVVAELAAAIAAAIADTPPNSRYPSFTMDAGGRSRVSQVTTLGDYKHHTGVQSLLMDTEIIGTATCAFDDTIPGMAMTTSAANDAAIHQSVQWHNYQSGKSHLIEATCSRFDSQTNVTKRLGYFSSNTTTPFASNYDGVYVESNGTDNDFYFVIIKNGTITEKISRSIWDDPLNGFGPSGITADFSNFTVWAIDFLWLGGTDFTLWYKHDDGFYLACRYHHAGNKPAPAILSPNKPVRYEIRQSGVGSGAFNMICAQVSSEGATNELGTTQCVSTKTNSIYASTPGTYYAICGYRLKATTRGVTTRMEKLSFVETSGANNEFHWEIRLNPTVADVFTYNPLANSNLEVAIGDYVNNPSKNTVTLGTVLDCGMGSDAVPLSEIIKTALRPGSKIDGTVDEIVLCVSPFTNNERVAGGYTILEFL